MRRYSLFILSLLFLASAGIKAQDSLKVWTLRDCISYALENNIQIKKSKVTSQSSKEDTELAKAQMFPSLSASVTQGLVNYPSNRVVSNTTYSGNYTANASLKLFDGNKRVNTIKQQKIQNQIDELSIQQNENQIEISLVKTYMQVLYAMESVSINKNTVEVSQAQRDRAQELYKAGSISPVDLAQLESQLSSDKYQLIVSQTNLDNYKLQLKQLLELNINDDIKIAYPNLSDNDVLTPLPKKQDIYDTSLSVMPEITSSKLNVNVANIEIQKARAGFLPSLSLNAGIGTGHLSGTDYTLGSQLWDKFNESIGLTVSIPIFSNRENKTTLNKAKYAVTTSQLEQQDAEKTLLKAVEGVYLDATSSQTQYTSAKENLAYVKQSYDLTQEQFFLGMKNTVELLTQKNNYLTAQQEVLQAKYMSIMSIQLLNIYQKKAIEVNY